MRWLHWTHRRHPSVPIGKCVDCPCLVLGQLTAATIRVPCQLQSQRSATEVNVFLLATSEMRWMGSYIQWLIVYRLSLDLLLNPRTNAIQHRCYIHPKTHSSRPRPQKTMRRAATQGKCV